MAGATRYIKSSGDHEEFYDCTDSTKEISRHKGILKYLIKK